MKILNIKKYLPVIAEVDLLIIGGGIAGCSAAYAYAASGKKVYIIEKNTFLGYEIGIWQRPWLVYEKDKETLIRQWFPYGLSELRQRDVIPLHMDQFKRKLEDLMLDSKIKILYGTLPFEISKNSGKWKIVIGNRSGRQVISAGKIIDATENCTALHLVSAEECEIIKLKQNSTKKLVRRTLEFTGVETDHEKSIKLPFYLGIYNNIIDLYQGAYSKDHILIDIAVEIREDHIRSLKEDVEVEYSVRKKSLEVAEYIIKSVPAFKKAILGMGSLQVMYGDEFNPIDLVEAGLKIGSQLMAKEMEENKCIVVGLENNIEVATNSIYKVYSTYQNSFTYMEKTEFNQLYRFPEVEVGTIELNLFEEVEVAVVGGGTSGAVAARVSAQEGVKTVLAEMNSALGGTGTVGGVNSYWYGYKNSFTEDIEKRVEDWNNRISFSQEVCPWRKNDCWSHEIKAFVLLEMCIERKVSVLFNCILIGTLMNKDNVIGLVFVTPYGPGCIISKVTVDATGDGDVAAFSGAEYAYGNERDRMTMWASMAQYKAPGVCQGNFATTVDMQDILDFTRFIIVSRRRGGEHLIDHGSYIAPRESRHIKGDILLTLTDQLRMRKYKDTVSLCFSNHDPKGKSTSDLIYFGILPPNLEIEIPYRAFLPKGLEQLLVTGKALSSTHDALPAIRMQPDLQNQGGTVGMAAALCIKNVVTPRNLNVKELQKYLVGIGSLPQEVLEDREEFLSADYKKIINELTGDEPFEWLEMSMKEKAINPSPIVLICVAEKDQVFPLLYEAYSNSNGKKKLLLARLLVWHGCEEAAQDVIEEIKKRWNAEPPLPKRKSSIRFCQLYPDHGVMTELTYLINDLSRVKSKKIIDVLNEFVERIGRSKRDYGDMRECIFSSIESVTYVAERISYSEFIPLLERLLELPELQNLVHCEGIEVDLVGERLSYLVLCIARAIARCGSKKGLYKLAEFVQDNRSLLARSAQDELEDLMGVNFGREYENWIKEIDHGIDKLLPAPWIKRLE